jgi:hypothetical protein
MLGAYSLKPKQPGPFPDPRNHFLLDTYKLVQLIIRSLYVSLNRDGPEWRAKVAARSSIKIEKE